MRIINNIIINLWKRFIFKSLFQKIVGCLKTKIMYKKQNDSKIIKMSVWYNSRESNLSVRRLYNEKYRPIIHIMVIRAIITVKKNNIVDFKMVFIFLYSCQFSLIFFMTNHFLSSIHGSLLIYSSDFHLLLLSDLKIEYIAIIVIVKKINISIIVSISIFHHQIFPDISQNSHMSK